MAAARCVPAMMALALSAVAHAAPPPISIPVSPEDAQAAPSPGVLGFLNGINRSSTLLGNLWGLRGVLAQHGMSLALQETSEYLGNTSGGTRTGFLYDGLTQAVLQLDTQRAYGLYGGTFNVSGLQIHGQNLSAQNLQTLQTASGIEADRATRLWELWYDQKFLDEDRLDIKVGQQSLDQEFMVSTNALVFVNTMFGWPMLPSADLPGGGPAYPLSALGVRASARPVNGLTVLAGVFSGSPVKNNSGDPQQQNAHGTTFARGNGTLSIVELQFSYPALGSMVRADDAPALGWTYRVGAWYDTRPFADQRYDVDGLSLASPASNGSALSHRGDHAIYAVADRLIWRDDADPNRTVAVFARVMGTPLKDRNLIDFSLNAGLVFHSPFRYRTDDTFGLGMGYAHVSARASALDRDTVAFSGVATPVRGSETYVEATYQYQMRPWLQLQPDLQYVWNPGAGVADPIDPLQRIHNEWVMGLRANVSF
jgi:porin